MTVTHLAAALIRNFEGCRLTSYQDSGGVWTIGFGTTKGIKAGMTITLDEAELMLQGDIAQLLTMVDGKPLVAAAAMVSFGYNCGAGALKKVLAGQSKLLDYTHAGGKVLPGLVARRALEQALIEAGS